MSNIPDLINEFLAQPVWHGHSMEEWLENGFHNMIDRLLRLYESEGNQFLRMLEKATGDKRLKDQNLKDICAWEEVKYEQIEKQYEDGPCQNGWLPIMNRLDRRKRGYELLLTDRQIFCDELLGLLEELKRGKEPTKEDWDLICRASIRQYSAFKPQDCAPEDVPDEQHYDKGIFIPSDNFLKSLRCTVKEHLLQKEPGNFAKTALNKTLKIDEKEIVKERHWAKTFNNIADDFSSMADNIRNSIDEIER